MYGNWQNPLPDFAAALLAVGMCVFTVLLIVLAVRAAVEAGDVGGADE